MATPRLMGAEVRRKEDPRLITGTSSYVGDLALPGMHYVAFVRSPHATRASRRSTFRRHSDGPVCSRSSPATTSASSARRCRWPAPARRQRGRDRQPRPQALSAVGRSRAPRRRGRRRRHRPGGGSRRRRRRRRRRLGAAAAVSDPFAPWPRARRASTMTRPATSSIGTPSRPATRTASSPRPSAW